jgi:methionyl aminopeptidase
MEGNLDDWKKAGNIAHESLIYGKSMIRKNAKMIDVCDRVEEKIIELGGRPAFPVQISMDHVAAHYCPSPNDDIIFQEQLCCLDVGVEVNGAIGDNACTVDLSGKYSDLVKASEEALQAATEVLEVGVTLGKIGRSIQDAITSRGFAPIRNLSGHGLGIYGIHTSPSIPNYDTGDNTKLLKGMTIAIEPFATDGKGMIHETNNAEVFMLEHKKPVRNPITRQVLSEIDKFKGLPFTTRWLTKKFPEFKVNYALNELAKAGSIHMFPPLTEVTKGMVSQAENSFLIDDEVITLTK